MYVKEHKCKRCGETSLNHSPTICDDCLVYEYLSKQESMKEEMFESCADFSALVIY